MVPTPQTKRVVVRVDGAYTTVSTGDCSQAGWCQYHNSKRLWLGQYRRNTRVVMVMLWWCKLLGLLFGVFVRVPCLVARERGVVIVVARCFVGY